MGRFKMYRQNRKFGTNYHTVHVGIIIIIIIINSVQVGIYALGKAHMRSTPFLRGFPNFAFETVPMFV